MNTNKPAYTNMEMSLWFNGLSTVWVMIWSDAVHHIICLNLLALRIWIMMGDGERRITSFEYDDDKDTLG